MLATLLMCIVLQANGFIIPSAVYWLLGIFITIKAVGNIIVGIARAKE